MPASAPSSTQTQQRHMGTRLKGRTAKGRARLVTAAAFVLTLPALALGVLRANGAGDDVNVFVLSHAVFDEAKSVEMALLKVDAALVMQHSDPNADHQAALGRALDAATSAHSMLDEVVRTARSKPVLEVHLDKWRFGSSQPLLGEPSLATLTAAMSRARQAIEVTKEGALEESSVRHAQDAIQTARRYTRSMTSQARRLTQERAEIARHAMSKAERDQLVVFLLVLSAFPLVVAFGPSWALAPLSLLRSIAGRIHAGRSTSFSIEGADEVAEVSRALHNALVSLEQGDARKTHKILEMKKLTRGLLASVRDPVVILGRGSVIDYVNESAAQVLGQEVHHIEKASFDEVVFSPELSMRVDLAWTGELPEGPVVSQLEGADGQVHNVNASFRVVQDHSGDISRVIVALPKMSLPKGDEANI
ncbi:MAG: PAS domain S-box protein [Deltaproteobacteria bacterium]|nr:PAS domain S-box protein [Deltaproteobacteria bacterium]